MTADGEQERILDPGATAPVQPIARQSTLVILNSVVGAAQGYLALLVIGRYMGNEVYAARGYALALVSLVGIVARLGLPTTHVRRLGRGDEVAASNGTYLLLKAGLTALFMLLAGAALFVWFEVLRKPASDTTPSALWFAYWIVVVQSLRDVPVNTFQGLRRIAARESVLLANTVVTLVPTLLVGIAYADSHGRWSPLPALGRAASALLGVHGPLSFASGVDLLMRASLFGEMTALALAAFLFVRMRLPLARPRPGMVGAYLLFTVPLMFLAAGEVATKWVSQVMVGFWWDANAFSAYASASKLTEIMLLLGTGIAIVLLPAVSRLQERGQAGASLRMVHDAERWTSLLLWPVVAASLLFAAPIVHVLLWDRVSDAAAFLPLLALQGLLTCLLLPAQTLAIASGAPRLAARVVMTSVAVAVAVGVLLIPQHLGAVAMPGLGAAGAALATLAGTLAALVLYQVPHRGWPGHSYLRAPLAKHMAAAVVAAVVVWALPLPMPERAYMLAAECLLLALVYGAILAALGELRRDDWGAIRRLLRPGPQA